MLDEGPEADASRAASCSDGRVACRKLGEGGSKTRGDDIAPSSVSGKWKMVIVTVSNQVLITFISQHHAVFPLHP